MSLDTPVRPAADLGLGPAADIGLGLADGDARLRAVLALAAPAQDRRAACAGGGVFVPTGATAAGDDAVAQWYARAGARADLHVRLLTDAAVAAGRDPRHSLAPLTLPDDVPADALPDWARGVLAFLAAQPLDATPGSVAACFDAAADALLPPDRGPGGEAATAPDAVQGVPLTARARAGLHATARHRLSEATRLALRWEAETRHALPDPDAWATADLPCDRAAWLERFERLPGLAHAVGITCARWQRAYAEMLRRLALDLPLLRERMWDGADPGALDGVRGDAGDRHAGGRCVALLTFTNGQGVVYKPKDQRHADAWADVVGFLNRSAGARELHERVLISRVDPCDTPGSDLGHAAYGWEELVQADPVADEAGVGRFYRRLGMLIRLVQLLEGRDLWADNLLACGDTPVITDLECLLYPRVQVPPSQPSGQAGLLDALEASVVRTAMPAQPWTPQKGRRPLDIGCLSRVGDALGPDGGPLLPLPPYRPVVAGGGVADPWAYVREVIAGYRRMQGLLVEVRDDLLAPDGPLAAFAGVPTRYIWRHTWDGYGILRASLSPRALTGGIEREIVLAQVVSGSLPAVGADGTRRDILEMVLHEVEAFRDLDVPMFTAATDSDELRDADGRLVRGHLQDPAWDRLRRRVEELADFDLDAHVDVLSASLDAAREGTPLDVPAGTPLDVPAGTPVHGREGEGTRVPPAAGSARRATPGVRARAGAVAIGELLLAARVRDRGSSGWLAQSWYPGSGLRQVEVAAPDLLAGSAGAAVFLAELAAVTGDERFAEAATEALRRGHELIRGPELPPGVPPPAPRFAADARLAGGHAVPGGFFGPGALVHALARAGHRLGDGSLVAAGLDLLPLTFSVLDGAAGKVSAEPGFGHAGALLNLLRLRAAAAATATPGWRPDHDARVAGLVDAVADDPRTGSDVPGDAAAAGLEAGSYRSPTCPQGDLGRLAELTPTGAAASALALATAAPDRGSATGDRTATAQDGREAALAGWVPRSGRRGDRLAVAAMVLTGHRSAPGAALAQHGRVPREAEPGVPGDELPAAIGEALTLAAAHAVLGDATQEARWHAAAHDRADLLLDRYDATGRWFPDRVIHPRLHLSSLDGVGAAGLALLRLVDPRVAPLDLLW